MGGLTVVVLSTSLLAGGLAAGQRGVVSALTVSPQTTAAGGDVTATATGTNPCGAVHIDWGDGTALTYAIVDIPVTQRHTYAKAGAYEVRARGMGNCDGQATARVQVTPAPAPAQTSARVQRLEVTPNPAVAPATVEIVVQGTGTCSYVLDFGDGNSERRNASLPDRVRHTYSAPNAHYPVAARGEGNCEGLARRTLSVNAARAPDRGRRLSGVSVSPSPATARSQVVVTVEGSGSCAVTVDFGDGSDQRFEGALPARVTHTYLRSGVYEVYAWADPPCGGDASATLRVRGSRR